MLIVMYKDGFFICDNGECISKDKIKGSPCVGKHLFQDDWDSYKSVYLGINKITKH